MAVSYGKIAEVLQVLPGYRNATDAPIGLDLFLEAAIAALKSESECD